MLFPKLNTCGTFPYVSRTEKLFNNKITLNRFSSPNETFPSKLSFSPFWKDSKAFFAELFLAHRIRWRRWRIGGKRCACRGFYTLSKSAHNLWLVESSKNFACHPLLFRKGGVDSKNRSLSVTIVISGKGNILLGF
ncbi:hypothetical protein NPIL_81121 [Nephila pilipes]|uniref:Uncharacterized protein n=1 Tax=Nephila pilipes TaxID=299642 RepID=A0A8X6NFG0_NEPPI|nr:hypothetical protein NPIL_81121 [Nephila pilipes]